MNSSARPRPAKPFQYQQTKRYFATIADGVEELGAQELSELGATEVLTSYRGVYFTAEREVFYRINYCARMITRVLAPLASFPCPDTETLYKVGRNIPWESLLTNDTTFAIIGTVSNTSITHSQYAALCLKDSIVDRFRDATGKRPNVNVDNPDVGFNLHVERDKATISVDASAGSLHRRGYRELMVDAPISECVAATIIRMSEWDGERPIYDPFCGSGTLLCEALMRHARIPASSLRTRFGIEGLPDFDRTLWLKVKHDATANIREPQYSIISGSDISERAIEVATTNSRHLQFGDRIRYKVRDFRDIDNLSNTTIVCNPPFGVRLGDKEQSAALYKEFGNFLKHRCKGSTAYIYTGDPMLVKSIGLKPTWRRPLKNGGLDGRLVRIDAY